MADITMHNVSLKIAYEMPGNSLCAGIQSGDGTLLTCFFRDIEQWFVLRSILPKADGYYLSMATPAMDYPAICDHQEADVLAREFYEQEKGKMKAAAEAVPVEPTSDEMEIVF